MWKKLKGQISIIQQQTKYKLAFEFTGLVKTSTAVFTILSLKRYTFTNNSAIVYSNSSLCILGIKII